MANKTNVMKRVFYHVTLVQNMIIFDWDCIEIQYTLCALIYLVTSDNGL